MTKYTLMITKTGARSCRINATGETLQESADPARYAELRKRAIANMHVRGRDQAYRDCGLVRVRGASGGIYWE